MRQGAKRVKGLDTMFIIGMRSNGDTAATDLNLRLLENIINT